MNSSNMKSRSKSSLFLMELIIVIMFFSLSAAICMKVFATAKVKTDYSREFTGASFAAESLAEMYKEFDGDIEVLAERFDGSLSETGILTVYYDKDWKSSDKENAAYILTVTETEENNLQKALIEADDTEGRDLFEIVAAVSTV